ncbi:MAG: helix-turn-helix domain-containing protein [Calditrichaeota bacterium]|nr:helix-turn-helix domain-containing protein [Calditrichota bacterium]
MNLYNTEEAAKILGVNVSTIKRWSSAGKLKCIRTAGGHRKFEMTHLTEFIQNGQKPNTRINSIPMDRAEDSRISEWILKSDFKNLVNYIQKQAIHCNRNKILDVFKGMVLAKIPLYDIYDHLITPTLHQIGSTWEKGQISVIEEHFASQTLKDTITRLQGMINFPEKKLGVVMAMNLENELHDIVLKMVDHILEFRGYKVLYSGQLTPLINLEHIFDDYAPKRLYISSTYVENLTNAQLEFDSICQTAERFNLKIFVGGSGFDYIDYNKEPVINRLHSFKDIYSI